MVIKSILIWLATNNDKKSTHCRRNIRKMREKRGHEMWHSFSPALQINAKRKCICGIAWIMSYNCSHHTPWTITTISLTGHKQTKTEKVRTPKQKLTQQKTVMNRKNQTTNAFMGYILSAHSQRTYFCFYDLCWLNISFERKYSIIGWHTWRC